MHTRSKGIRHTIIRKANNVYVWTRRVRVYFAFHGRFPFEHLCYEMLPKF